MAGYFVTATAFVDNGDAAFAFDLLRRGIETQPWSARASLAKYLPEQQEILYREFCRSKDSGQAQVLSDLWRKDSYGVI